MSTRHRIEIWAEIPGFPGYEASDQGRVRSWRSPSGRGRPRQMPLILKQVPLGRADGGEAYLVVSLHGKTHYVHRLVLISFFGFAANGMQALHNDGDKKNNRLPNLSWGTAKDNAADRDRHEKTRKGSRHWCSKLTEDDVREIRRLCAEGVSQQKIAERFGIIKTHVSDVNCRRSWEHVN